jgi:hypothetical protein
MSADFFVSICAISALRAVKTLEIGRCEVLLHTSRG